MLSIHKISHKNSEICTPCPLIAGCKFPWSFLAATAWHSFLRLGTTLNQVAGGILLFLSKSNIVSVLMKI